MSASALASAAESTARAFDAALAAGDKPRLASLLADRCVLHADGVSLRRDVVGKGAVAAYFNSFVDR